MVDQACCLVDYQIQHWKGWTSLFRKIFVELYNGRICKFGEQVHCKRSGHRSSRVDPRWELGAWVGKIELIEHLFGTFSGIRNSRTIYRLLKSHCHSKDTYHIVGTPVNPKPEVWPRIHRSGDSTSLNDGWMNTVLLLAALTVKVGVR